MEKQVIFDNVRTIGIDLEFEGNGCVNYDSNDQKYILNKYKFCNAQNENNKLGKKCFSKDEKTYKYKVSSECLRHYCFFDEIEFENSKISYLPTILYNAIASPAFLLKGYVFTVPKSIKKKSPLTLTDAVETGEGRTVCNLEVHSKAGERSDTSLYFSDNVGKANYESNVVIDLTELQFISDDSTYDRRGVGVDGGPTEQLFLSALKRHLGTDYKFDYYYMKKGLTMDEWAEKGILLTQDNVDFLVKDMIRRLFNIVILRKGSYLKYKPKSAKLILTCGDGTIEKITLDINDLQDLANYKFNYWRKYEMADEEKILKNKELIEQIEKSISAMKEEKNSKKK